MDAETLDPAYVAARLAQPPFVTIAGVVNVRDLGSYPTDRPGYVTKPGALYRAGEVSYITEEGEYLPSAPLPARAYGFPSCVGKRQMRDLGVTTVYDLRSDTEMVKYDSPIPTIDGVEVVHVPVFQKEDYSPEAMAQYVVLRYNYNAPPISSDEPSLQTVRAICERED